VKARDTTAGRVLLVAGSVLALAVAAALAWAIVIDYQARGLVTKGVTLVDRNLSAMTEPQVRAAVAAAVEAPLMRPVTVSGDRKTWVLDPRGMVSVDIDSMVASAYAPRRTAPLVSRLTSQLGDSELPAQITPAYSIDATAVTAWVAQCSKQVDRRPVNARREVVKYKFKVTPAVYGAKVDRPRSAQLIQQSLTSDTALSSARRVVTLAVGFTRPKVLEKDFETALIVSLPECKIRLYKGAKLVKTYRCAPGRAAFPTPSGDFKVVSKQRYASWYNPGSAWAAGMPAVIGPGPSNPMGVTKIGIDAGAVYMHGVPAYEYDSIGTHASHGCMRMMPNDVLDLYGRVKLGTPVYIRG
jgi:lipoprotein-anchoring transpeptidase ErfK/SrfK